MTSTDNRPPSIEDAPERGRFGGFGGQYVPETLMPAVAQLDRAFQEAWADPGFRGALDSMAATYVGRPTPLYYARRLTEHVGACVYLKREDLAHTGAHKINNALGQAMLARRMGKRRIIAETGAGQHGVATATVCAVLGLQAVVYMGEVDMERQAHNVYRMRLLGAEVRPVTSGSRTLKDAVNEAIRDWVTNVQDTHYLLGSAVGPHPYPLMVREFQAVIGREARAQILEAEGRLPDYVVACVGGGSNAIGIFHPFAHDAEVALIGVEAAGRGLRLGDHAATLVAGTPGVLHGSRSYVLQNEYGQIAVTHSVSAGLDYPGVGPEHSYLKDSGRARYVAVDDKDALAAFRMLCELEGILPALEPAHALAYVASPDFRVSRSAGGDSSSERGTRNSEPLVLVNLSGRGDKDVLSFAQATGERLEGMG